MVAFCFTLLELVLCNTKLIYLYKSSASAEMGDRLATIDMGRKLGAAVPLWRGSWVTI